MTFVKSLSLFPSPSESSFKSECGWNTTMSSHLPITTSFQMCDQKKDSAQFRLWVPLEFTSLVFEFSVFYSLLPKPSIHLSVGTIILKQNSSSAAGDGLNHFSTV